MGDVDDSDQPEAPAAAASWDAGDLGCGELVVELRFRLADLAPGDLFHLIAHDPGAREDLPAWCRMTRHPLRHAAHPHYFLERRRDP